MYLKYFFYTSYHRDKLEKSISGVQDFLSWMVTSFKRFKNKRKSLVSICIYTYIYIIFSLRSNKTEYLGYDILENTCILFSTRKISLVSCTKVLKQYKMEIVNFIHAIFFWYWSAGYFHSSDSRQRKMNTSSTPTPTLFYL